VAILKAPQDQASLDQLKAQLLQQINSNPDVRRAAITGAVQQLSVRQKFVGRKYRELLDGCSAQNAIELPDETVLMLTLSAARLRDAAAFDRWSQELKRRYPTAEMEKWLKELRAPAP